MSAVGDRAFLAASPPVWNSLLDDVSYAELLSSARQQRQLLETF